MEVLELRIGNYISKGQARWQVTISDLYNIKSGYKLNRFQPIQLTEEWLLKFGFYKHYVTKEDNQIWRKDWGEGYFDLEEIITFFFGHPCYSVSVNYVHKLQNLYFALTNEELCLKD